MTKKTCKSTTLTRWENTVRRLTASTAVILAILASFTGAANRVMTAAVNLAVDGALSPITIWATNHGLLPLWATIVVVLGCTVVVALAAQFRVASRIASVAAGQRPTTKKVSEAFATLQELTKG